MTRCKDGVIGRRTDRRGMPTGEAPASPNGRVASATLRYLTTDLLSGNRSCSITSVLESAITKTASRGSNGIFVHQDYRTTRVRRRHRAESAHLLSNRAGRTPCSGRVSRAIATTASNTRLAASRGRRNRPVGPKPVARIRRRSALLRATARLLRHPEPSGNHCHGSHCPT